MAKYDGLIIPRSYSEYINKTDAATHAQAHQLNGVLDPAPIENGQNAIKSGGVYTALGGRTALTFDDVPTDDSDNPVKSNGIYNALAGKQDTLTFDDVPTANSNNPVKSGGIFTAIKNASEITTEGDWNILKFNDDNIFIAFIKGNKSTTPDTWSGAGLSSTARYQGNLLAPSIIDTTKPACVSLGGNVGSGFSIPIYCKITNNTINWAFTANVTGTQNVYYEIICIGYIAQT